MKTMQTMKIFTAIALAGSVAACSGGGSSRSDTARTGVFIDSPVAGVAYRTATLAGVTNAAGEFQFNPGETVTFSLGALQLGSAPAAAEVNLFDIAGVSEVPTSDQAIAAQIYSSAASGMKRVMTIATLLQTFDEDADPENGISIPATLAARLESVDWDLDGNAWDLTARRDFRQILRAEAAANSNFVERQPRPAGAVLEHVYSQAGMSTTQWVSTSYRHDNNADGSIDYARQYYYDDNGLIYLDEYDQNGDGTLDLVIDYTRDAASHLLLRMDRDDGADGSNDSARVWAYNEFGDRTLYEELDAEGTAVYAETFRYADNGDLIYRERRRAAASHTIEQWEYNPESGRREIYYMDTDGDGTFDRRDEFDFATEYGWTGRRSDTNLDGVIDAVYTRSFDAQGRLLRETGDTNNDGVTDTLSTNEYDDAGNLLMAGRDNDADGVTEHVDVYRYDAAGNRTLHQRDADGDGVWNLVRRYTYNSDGRLLEQVQDSDGDGVDNRVITYAYNAAGQHTHTRQDNNADGTIDRVQTNTYDELGRQTRYEYDADNDGQANSITVYDNFVQIPMRAMF